MGLASSRWEAARFFYDNAGTSYHPEHETPEEGRIAGAYQLAAAEAIAKAAESTFEWWQDDQDNHEAHDCECEPDSDSYPLFGCSMLDSTGEIIGSIGGVDLGSAGFSEPQPYARVIEAELAAEHYPA